jgi:hypothetical protein
MAIGDSTAQATVGAIRSYRGLFDHLTVNNTLVQQLYGAVNGGFPEQTYPTDWVFDISTIAGTNAEQAIFIEDCTFTGAGHQVLGHANAHTVVRHNTFNLWITHIIDDHGPHYSAPGYLAGRLLEIYDNTFNALPGAGGKAIGIRGGSAIIYNNTFNDFDNGTWLGLDVYCTVSPYSLQTVSQTYIWGNTYNQTTRCLSGLGPPSTCGTLTGYNHCCQITLYNGTHDANCDAWAVDVITENTKFFTRALSAELDGWIYTAYTYPHPFITDCVTYPNLCDSSTPDTTPPAAPSGVTVS